MIFQRILNNKSKKKASKTQWELKSEEAVISYLIKALEKKKFALEKGQLLKKIKPHILKKISHPGLKERTEGLFSKLRNIYQTLENRTTESQEDDFNFNSFDFDSQLPEFGEKEEQFLTDLAQEDKVQEIAQRLDEEEEHQKTLYISNMAFDSRFDDYFDKVVNFLSN